MINQDFTLTRRAKEAKLNQKGLVVWLYGLSGAGKSTLADHLDQHLFSQAKTAMILDGDVLRNGLNRDLGFSEEDRRENLRRAAEIARLLVNNGIIVIACFITPTNAMRQMIRDIIGTPNLLDVHVRCSYECCAERDPKGLYARAQSNQLKNFTGKDSAFEAPDPPATLTIDTEIETVTECSRRLIGAVDGQLSSLQESGLA